MNKEKIELNKNCKRIIKYISEYLRAKEAEMIQETNSTKSIHRNISTGKNWITFLNDRSSTKKSTNS